MAKFETQGSGAGATEGTAVATGGETCGGGRTSMTPMRCPAAGAGA